MNNITPVSSTVKRLLIKNWMGTKFLPISCLCFEILWSTIYTILKKMFVDVIDTEYG